MREIIFRGKRTDNGEWVEGNLVQFPHRVTIMSDGFAEVKPETVGQYIGLKDKKGRKIFEGDVVHAIHKEDYVGLKNTDFGYGVIEYNGTYYGRAAWEINIIGETGSRIFSEGLEVEIVGNIHDKASPDMYAEQIGWF